jgi:hypothetical protein
MKKPLAGALAALLVACALGPAAAQPGPTQDPSGGHPAYDFNANTLRTAGVIVPVGATFTTPAGTVAYSAGQLIANSATAGSVVPLQFSACLAAGGAGGYVGVRVKTTDTGFAGKKVVVKLHKLQPTYSNGDHAAWLTTESDGLPPISVTLSEHYADFEKGFGAPDNNGTANGRSLVAFDCNAGSQVIYGELVAGEAITPQGGKAFTVTLETVH